MKLTNFSSFSKLILLSMISSQAAASYHLQNWDGFYIGAQAGGGWSDTSWQYLQDNYFNTIGPIELGTDFKHNSNGAVAGVQIGFNYQYESLLIGLESSISAANLKADKESPFFPISDSFKTEIHWYPTVKGRLGYATNQWLAFISGGWAGAKVELTLNDNEADIVANSTMWSNGWTAGIGFDYKALPCITIGVAYDFMKLDTDSQSLDCPLCGSGIGFGSPVLNNDITLQTVTARVNYLFG